MTRARGKILGLAFGPNLLQIAEVQRGGAPARTAEFRFDELPSPARGGAGGEVAALGKQLAQFLKTQGFAARRAVAGLPAQWVMLKDKTVPLAAPDVIATMLRLQTEVDFSIEPAALIVDYVAGAATEAGQPVVLVAVLKERVEQVQQLAAAAGLALQALTATGVALAGVTHAPVLHLRADAVELAALGSDGLPRLRHVAAGSPLAPSGRGDGGEGAPAAATQHPSPLTPLPEGERGMAALLRRSLANFEAPKLTVWNDAGLDAAQLDALATATLTQFTTGSDAVLAGGAPSAAGAAALALSGLQPLPGAFDFLHSRLAPPPQPKFTRTARLGLAAAAAVLLGGAWFAQDWYKNAAEVDTLRAKRDGMKESSDSAKAFITRVNSTRTWYERRPNYLEALRALTLCFPEEGRVWTSSLSLHEDMHGAVTAHALDEKDVLNVLDKLKASPALAEVKMLYIRASAGKVPDVSFAVSFTFVGAENDRRGDGETGRRGAAAKTQLAPSPRLPIPPSSSVLPSGSPEGRG